MKEDFYFAWYFDVNSQPYQYGYTYWKDMSEYVLENDINHLDRASCELIETRSGTVEPKKLLELVQETIAYERFNQTATVLFDKNANMKFLAENFDSTEMVTREGLDTEQVFKYLQLINRGKYLVSDKFLQIPDLIFDEFENQNIIDPIYSDEQTSFPMTQSLLIFLEYISKDSGFSFASLPSTTVSYGY